MITAVPVPYTLLAVWDASGGYHKWAHYHEAYEWALDHGLEPNDTYRIEFYLVADIPYARMDRYKVNGDGCHYLDPATGEPAVEEKTVTLSEPPPERLRCFQ